MKRVFIHIGMHKTASTYIQQSLQSNRALLRRHFLYFDNGINNRLKTAVSKRKFSPWKEQLLAAERCGCDLLVSHEAFSHLLASDVKSSSFASRGGWLAGMLQDCEYEIVLIAFIRDQPDYLNSQYVQHIKNFSISASFEEYAVSMMGHTKNRGECDPCRLFGWIMADSHLQSRFIPFGIDRDNDPFRQFLSALGVDPDLGWRKRRPSNLQLGRLATETALLVSILLKESNLPCSGKKDRKLLSDLLKRSGHRLGWSKERFKGLTPVMYEAIRSHYRDANDRFACAVWGVGSWSDLFPERVPKIVTPLNSWQLWLVQQNAEYLVRKFQRSRSD